MVTARAISNTNACAISPYSDFGYKWTSGYTFYVSTTGKPASLSGSGFASAAVAAVGNWHTVNNQCGAGDSMALSSSYGGTTSLSPSLVTSQPLGCNLANRDYLQVFGWRFQSGGGLGGTCTFAVGGAIQESDIALNPYYGWVNYPTACSGSYYTEDVMTHEIGHFLGLQDLYGASYSGQTMYEASAQCLMVNTTLALGDVNGINTKY